MENINSVPIKRRRSQTDKRKISRNYFLPKDPQTKIRVCQQFILDTLCISSKFIISLKVKDIIAEPNKHVANIVPENVVRELKTFIESLPAVPSHYNRSKTTRKYLPSSYESALNVYRTYVKFEKEKYREYVSRTTFMKIFKTQYNIGIHMPKKDKCSLCEKYKNMTDDEKDEETIKKNDEHIKEKNRCLSVFSNEQEQSKLDSKMVVCSIDMQKVLQSPHGDSMLLYYSRKYSVYNFSIYDSSNRNGICFVWGETDGNRGANEIASCLIRYFQSVDEREVCTISLYADNCFGQNKNRIIIAAVRYFLNVSLHVKSISITYLVAGHTYMTVDSVHAVIERYTRKKIVWGPSECPTLIRNARVNPFPYIVHSMQFSDFLDFKKLINNRSFTKTKNNDTIKISTIRKFTMTKYAEDVKFCYSLEPNSPQYMAKFLVGHQLNSVYTQKLAVNEKKYNDLINLCKNGTIPKTFHGEYYSMRSDSKKNEKIESEEDETD